MIRKQVENLRGLVLTPEELDFISPIIAKSLEEMNTQLTLMNSRGESLELEGTEKRIEAFEAERKERNDARAMSFIETAELALKHGLSVKKVITRE